MIKIYRVHAQRTDSHGSDLFLYANYDDAARQVPSEYSIRFEELTNHPDRFIIEEYHIGKYSNAEMFIRVLTPKEQYAELEPRNLKQWFTFVRPSVT
jgi:hypothetical protein